MLTLDPKTTAQNIFHSYLVGAIAPRPIAFASTIDKEGNCNLSPFSFFNVFSSNPPVLIFSPARSGKTGQTKHTHDNVKQVPEVVINIVDYNMVQQMSLASTMYPKGVDEFEKAGFTKLRSDTVKPFRVAEAPVTLECKVLEIKELGENGGAGNLIICEVQRIHVKEEVLDENQHIDPKKIDLVSRMGGDWYCRANGDALFRLKQPTTTIGIGVDEIPATIKNSKILTGNNLGQLATVEKLPSKEEAEAFKTAHHLQFANEEQIHSYAQNLLESNKVDEAWKILLAYCDKNS